MKLAINILLYIFIAFMVLQNHLLIAGLAVVLFTYRCGAGLLVPMAFMIDGYFGAFHQLPLFTIGACIWFFVSELIRPRLLLQYVSYEKTS